MPTASSGSQAAKNDLDSFDQGFYDSRSSEKISLRGKMRGDRGVSAGQARNYGSGQIWRAYQQRDGQVPSRSTAWRQ
jgi:hypothetical protein